MKKRPTQLSKKKMMDNIIVCFNAATQEQVAGGMSWYSDARDAAYSIAEKHGVPVYIVVAVIAALSPNNKWTRNVSNADELIGAFIRGDGMDSVKVSTYHKMKQKAWSILSTRADYDTTKTMLNGQKITSFFCDIMGEFNVTVDGHARNIAYNERVGLTDDRTNIGVREYRALQIAYKEAAKTVGTMPYQLQAITWRVWRDRHGIT